MVLSGLKPFLESGLVGMPVSFIAKDLLQFLVQYVVDGFLKLLTEDFRENTFKLGKIMFIIQ
jgi:hypothetical protein